jgi:hypothetical protein
MNLKRYGNCTCRGGRRGIPSRRNASIEALIWEDIGWSVWLKEIKTGISRGMVGKRQCYRTKLDGGLKPLYSVDLIF